MAKTKKNILIPSFIAACCIFLVGLTVNRLWHMYGTTTDVMIAEHIEQLSAIFKRIDKECSIIDFEHQRNYIDFLTVIAFEGSEVGPMNVRYPKKWQGPYLKDNPTMQTKYYEIVKTQKGYFIVPGQGVTLSNGKVIGKDIIFDGNADIAKMLETEDVLVFHGRPLAAPLSRN